ALPTEAVKGVTAAPRTPKALPKRDVDRLLREAERHGNKRNLAVLLTLRHTGLRVGELCALRLGDVALSERKGQVRVHSGKGNKDRVIPLNHDARLALSAYLAVRPALADDHLFVGQRGEPLQPQAVQLIVRKYATRLIVRKYATRAGLSGVTP